MICPFCNIKTSNDINDTILYENKYFYIVPAKGPLVSGHVLIVSKKHDLSLLCIDFAPKKSFKLLITEIISNMPAYNKFLIFEHGSYKNGTGGKTIDHTHIHVFPNFNIHKNILNSEYILEKTFLVADIPNTTLKFPYLLIGDAQEISIYNGVDVESQIIRIKIAETNSKFVPYWQDSENISAVNETIKIWKDVKF